MKHLESSSSRFVIVGSLCLLALAIAFGRRAPTHIHLSKVAPAPTVREVERDPDEPEREPRDEHDRATTAVVAVKAHDAKLDRQHIYWTEDRDDGVALVRGTLDGSGTEVIAEEAGYGFALTDTHVVYSNAENREVRSYDKRTGEHRVLGRASSEPLEIVVGGGYVYFTAWNARIQRVPVGGGRVESLGVGGAADPIAADDDHLYIAHVQGETRGKLLRVRHGSPREVTTLAPRLEGPQNVVVAGKALYVTAGSHLYRIAAAGGALETVASAGEASRLVAHGGTLYWTSWADERVASTTACDGFQRGVVREVDLSSGAITEVDADCSTRGVAAGDGGVYQIEEEQLVRVR